jgi:hypothetical protein
MQTFPGEPSDDVIIPDKVLSRFRNFNAFEADEFQYLVVKFSRALEVAHCQRSMIDTSASQLPCLLSIPFRGFVKRSRKPYRAFLPTSAATRVGSSGCQMHTTSRPQICAAPPSTNSSVPVTKVLSSEARKTAALAISSGVPKRPMGTLLTIVVNICWPARPDCARRS